MHEAIRHRLDLAKEMFRRPWFRRLLVIWAAISTWDTFISQMLPEKVAANAPRVHKVIFGLLDMTSGWVSLWGWLLVGAALVVVSSIEFAFPRGPRRANSAALPSAPRIPEKDKLDYLVEGTQAVSDITKAVNTSNRETVRIGKILNRYALVLPFISNPKLKRWLLSKAAADINSYSAKVRKTAEFIGTVTPAVSENQIKFIEGLELRTEQDKTDLKTFIETIHATSEIIIPTAVEGFEGMRTAAGSIKGITGELNAASSQLHMVVGLLIEKINGFGTACEQMRSAAMNKIATAEVK